MGLPRLPTLANHVVEIDRRPVRYVAAGSGAPVVLLHGWGARIESWGPIPAILAERFRVLAPDLPGFGETPGPDRAWGTYEYADFLATFLETQELSKPVLVGHSFGGRTSIALAARRPELVGKLVLVDSAGI